MKLESTQPQDSSQAHSPTAAEGVVDAIDGVFGKQVRNRAIHAKGIVVDAMFTPSATAAGITRAPHLQKEPTAVTVRFSNFSGNPNVADTDPMASPRGMALKFRLADGTATDIVAHSFNGFPTKTTEDFRQLFVALAASGPQVAHPTPAETFLGNHPHAKAFFEAPKPPPVSYTTLRYFGVNSFKFTNAAGQSVIGRYRLEPEAGEQFLAGDVLATTATGYLQEELRARVSREPCRFLLTLQISAPDDRIDDPSVAWPDTRPTIALGTLELRAVVADSVAAEQGLMFSPAAVPAGIEPTDPMVRQRSEAYPVSYARRHT